MASPAGPDCDPLPGRVVLAGGSVVASSWLSTVYFPATKTPYGQMDSVTALSAADGTTHWRFW